MGPAATPNRRAASLPRSETLQGAARPNRRAAAAAYRGAYRPGDAVKVPASQFAGTPNYERWRADEPYYDATVARVSAKGLVRVDYGVDERDGLRYFDDLPAALLDKYQRDFIDAKAWGLAARGERRKVPTPAPRESRRARRPSASP